VANVHTRSRSGFITRNGVRRRESIWLTGGFQITGIATASTAVFVASLNAAALALRPFTVVRTRGHLYLRSDQIAAAEAYDISYGMAVVSDQASAIANLYNLLMLNVLVYVEVNNYNKKNYHN